MPHPAYEALLRGDPGRLEATLSEADPAWDAALRSLAWLAGLPEGRLDERGLPSAGDPEALAAACANGVQAAFLAFDPQALSRWLELLALAAPRDPRLALARCKRAVLAADVRSVAVDAKALADEASRRGDPVLLVEATSLLALAHLDGADVEEATRVARRAVRMARTEELPMPQYFAGLVLARVRRHAHQYHLAIRILSALARVAPSPWQPWVRWELLLSGDRAETPPVGESPRITTADRIARSLHAGLAAAAAGDATAFRDRLDAAQKDATDVPWLARDVTAVAALVDPDVAVSGADAALRPWMLGRETLPPFGLLAIGQHPDDPDQGLLTHVVAAPGAIARRTLGLGASLAAPAVRTSRPGRIETAASVLALAGDAGIAIEPFFEAVYGFPYERELHRGPLEVLIHRVRELFEGTARIERADTLRLECDQPFTVPDPRCKRSLDDEILGAIARAGAGSAKGAARTLSLPLRTVQHALRRLVEDGACSVEKQGRNVCYRIEDTTFSEPTERHRWGRGG